MKKIPSLFVRDYERIITDYKPISVSIMADGSYSLMSEVISSYKARFLATQQVTPGCEWVINGEGVATRKWDGIACMIQDGILFKRYDAKHGKTPPEGFIPCQDPDSITGHWPGWLKVDYSDPANKWFKEAMEDLWRHNQECGGKLNLNGTYECIGPKINGNKDNIDHHILIKHGAQLCSSAPREYYAFLEYFSSYTMEGIVFHHPDGRMCKVKRTDFGLKW